MSWICLNGTMSTTVQGLLIQTLPPISKPLMRTMIEEIDGRDGDIVIKLGYSAYDKEITIGLHGDYDVDEVISFFNSEGEVIFSNEPDKFYRYQILEQIDFEHLLRFKTATVTFHVQPFKYSTIERPLSFEIDENTSSIEVINTGNYKSRPKITIYGNGNLTLGVNEQTIFAIALGTEGQITIDTESMEAFKGDTLKNRLVSGNYDKF